MAYTVYLDSQSNTGIAKLQVPQDAAGNTYNTFFATNDATAAATDIASGKTAYITSGKVTGTGLGLASFTGAVGPKLKYFGGAYQGMLPVGHKVEFSNDNSVRKATTALNSTNYSCGSGWSTYMGIRVVDLGGGYQLILHNYSSTNQLYATVVQAAQNGTLTAGTATAISTTAGSGFHFDAVALVPDASAARSTTTVFVCYNEDSTNYRLTGRVITVNKSAKTITAGTAVQLNSTTYRGYDSIGCAIMNYASSNYYILIGHGGGNSTNPYPYVTGVKVNGTTVTYGNTTKVGTTAKGSNPGLAYSNKIIRFSNTKAVFLYNLGHQLYAVGVTTPLAASATTAPTVGTPVLISNQNYSGYSFDAVPFIQDSADGYFYVACSANGNPGGLIAKVTFSSNTITVVKTCAVQGYQADNYRMSYYSQNYTWRVKCLRINTGEVYVIHASDSNGYLTGYKVMLHEETAQYSYEDPYYANTAGVKYISTTSTYQTCKMDACLDSNSGNIIIVHAGNSNCTMSYTTVYGRGVVNNSILGVWNTTGALTSGSYYNTRYIGGASPDRFCKGADIFKLDE